MKPLWLLLFLFPSIAFAEILHRCVAKDGHVSYQAQACAHGMRTDRMIHYVSEEHALKPDRDSPVRAGIGGSGRRTKRQARGSREPRYKEDRCRTAKVRREQALDRLGLNRTYAQLSWLDVPVRAACKGF